MVPSLNEKRFGVHITTRLEITSFDAEYYQVAFENGYGASIIRTEHSYGGPAGLFEIAVLHLQVQCNELHLCYGSPVTDDVIGYVPEQDVAGFLDQIAQLPRNDECCHIWNYNEEE